MNTYKLFATPLEKNSGKQRLYNLDLFLEQKKVFMRNVTVECRDRVSQ